MGQFILDGSASGLGSSVSMVCFLRGGRSRTTKAVPRDLEQSRCFALSSGDLERSLCFALFSGGLEQSPHSCYTCAVI